MSMTREQVLRALADGKEVELRLSGVGTCWVKFASHSVLDPAYFNEREFRLKPTPVPPGDLTYEEAQALHNSGVEVEWWNPCGKKWISCNGVSVPLRNDFAYRRKPAPRTVPLGPEDVKGGDMVRNMHFSRGWSLIVGARGDHSSKLDGVVIVGIDEPLVVGWVELRCGFEISRDGGKTWSKCEKEVSE